MRGLRWSKSVAQYPLAPFQISNKKCSISISEDHCYDFVYSYWPGCRCLSSLTSWFLLGFGKWWINVLSKMGHSFISFLMRSKRLLDLLFQCRLQVSAVRLFQRVSLSLHACDLGACWYAKSWICLLLHGGRSFDYAKLKNSTINSRKKNHLILNIVLPPLSLEP